MDLQKHEDEIILLGKTEIKGGNQKERENAVKELRKIFRYKLKVLKFSQSFILIKSEISNYE